MTEDAEGGEEQEADEESGEQMEEEAEAGEESGEQMEEEAEAGEESGEEAGEQEPTSPDETESDEGEQGLEELQEQAEGGDEEEPDTEGEGEQAEDELAGTGEEAQEEDREEPGGEETEMDEEMAGSEGDQEPTEPDFSAQSGTAPEAVERFDQLGQEADEGASEQPPETLADASGVTGESEGIPMMEQWLDQVEGDPAYLLQNQFMLEEHQLMQRRGGRLIEPRPW